MDSCYFAALEQIDTADIPAAVYRTAIRLLNMAVNGHVRLTKDEMRDICGTTTDGTVRSHLWQLSAACIIHYSTNEDVYVNFHAYAVPDPRAGRAQSWSERAKHSTNGADAGPILIADDDDRAQDARNDRQDARIIGQDARNDRPGAGSIRLGKVGRYDPNILDQENNTLPTSTPKATAEPPDLSTLKGDQVWAYTLLTDEDVGVYPSIAVACVRLNTASWIVRQVSAWWMQRDKIRVGALIWRLTNPDKSRPGPADPEFLDSDLYWRHYPLDEGGAHSWARWVRNRDYADVMGMREPTHSPELMALLEQLPIPGGER